MLDVGAAARLEHDELDPLEAEEMREHEPGGPRTDDADLGAHGSARQSMRARG